MDKALKQRLVGATVLIILTVIVLPMLLSGRSDTLNTESRQIDLPPKPDELSFETRRFPIGIPEKAQPAADDAETGNGTDSNTETPAEISAEISAGTSIDGVVKPPAVTRVIISPPGNTEVIGPEPAGDLQNLPRYLVQVASFSGEERAKALAAELRAAKMPVVMDVVDRTAGRLHRVRVGPYVESSAADVVVAQIRSMNKGLSPRILDTRPGDTAPVSAPSDPLVRWVVQTGSYNNSDTAESEVAKLRLAGLAAFSEKVTSANGTAYKVRIGPEIERARAVKLAKDIKTRLNINGFVTTQE